MTLRPNQNTYWVVPGKLLAGEYPGAQDSKVLETRINTYLDCGVDYFIDLTHSHELAPYAHTLAHCAVERGMSVVHQRFAIDDKGVPKDVAQMQEILGALRQALKGGRCVYVHCWGGIGRTGTVIGCYLAETNSSGDIALTQLKSLWPQMEKSNRHLQTPETAAQALWVKTWVT
jgi:predicted protein tyrosine phosphatase